ncbi:putative serine/threonine-protein kinase-like [Forsythia ovata]|uniref:Serine/threonine-protein kinase-like n=1 Tax=Forsythia ovata TaxID=205694 RepID=A0ABD1SJG1_9LAMI
MVDEVVEKDMSTKDGQWVEFEIEAFEEGVEIENRILASLVDELVEQLHKIFKLCGSPSEDYWRKSKLPHSTVFKPIQPYRRRIAEIVNFSQRDPRRNLMQLLKSNHDIRISIYVDSWRWFVKCCCLQQRWTGQRCTREFKIRQRHCMASNDVIEVQTKSMSVDNMLEDLQQMERQKRDKRKADKDPVWTKARGLIKTQCADSSSTRPAESHKLFKNGRVNEQGWHPFASSCVFTNTFIGASCFHKLLDSL